MPLFPLFRIRVAPRSPFDVGPRGVIHAGIPAGATPPPTLEDSAVVEENTPTSLRRFLTHSLHGDVALATLPGELVMTRVADSI
jgi:hypothetical protein